MGVNFWGTTAQLNLPGKVGVSCILEDLLIYTKDFLFWKEQDTLQYHLLTPNLIFWPLKDNIWHLMRNSYLWLFSQKMVTKEFSPRQLLNLWPEKKGRVAVMTENLQSSEPSVRTYKMFQFLSFAIWRGGWKVFWFRQSIKLSLPVIDP